MIILDTDRAAKSLAWVVIAPGVCALLLAAAGGQDLWRPDARLAFVALFALSIGATLLVKTPRAKAYVAASDVAVFVSLLLGGFRWTEEKTVVDIGPLQATAEEHKTLPIPPVVGALALIGGIVVLVVPTRRRA